MFDRCKFTYALELFLNRDTMKLKDLKNLCEEVGISGIKDVKTVLKL